MVSNQPISRKHVIASNIDLYTFIRLLLLCKNSNNIGKIKTCVPFLSHFKQTKKPSNRNRLKGFFFTCKRGLEFPLLYLLIVPYISYLLTIESSFLAVAGPYTPSATKPYINWNRLTAFAVSLPYQLSQPLFFPPLFG